MGKTWIYDINEDQKSKIDLTCQKGCKCVLDNIHNLNTHEKACTGKLFYQCGTCDEKFLKLQTLWDHMAQCQRIIENKTPTCEFCTKSFLTEVNLMKHIKICSTPCKCCICSETFNGAKLLEEHFQKCKQSLNCKICKTTFKTKSETDNHIKEKHAQ